MRKIIFGVANSLDNFIARKDGAVDWLLHGDEANEFMRDFWQKIDAMLMGRKTYEIGLKLSKGKMNPFFGIKTYVFSRTLAPEKKKDFEIITKDALGFIRRLKEQPGKDICLMGGGEFAKPLFEAGLIDEIGFNIQPVLLGSGIPLYHEMNRQLNLELLEARPFKNGCVLVRYRVKN